jgi:hypothetical protein
MIKSSGVSSPSSSTSDGVSSPKSESLLERKRASANLLDCFRTQKVTRLLSLNVRANKFLYAFSPSLDGILLPTDPAQAMHEKHTAFGSFDLMIGVGSASLDQFFPELSGQPVTVDRKERVARTLVRNLFTFHLQVQSDSSSHLNNYILKPP